MARPVLGHIVLFFASAPPENVPEVTGYLSRHYALALRNLGRFAEVEDLAYMDDLTHLFNTRYLHLVLDREVKNAAADAAALQPALPGPGSLQVRQRHAWPPGGLASCWWRWGVC